MSQSNKTRFNKGDIVYWCHSRGHNYSVNWGIVYEHFSDAVCVDYLKPKENRLVNGIHIDEFENQQRYTKLPKGWSYDTKLYKITTFDAYATIEEKLKSDGINFTRSDIFVNNPESIKLAYEYGFLVKHNTIFYGTIDTDITHEGYRIVKKYPQWQQHISNTSIRPDKVYYSYEDAKKEVDANTAEFHRQANLSDYDWSVEQIDNTLNRWSFIAGESDEVKNLYRKWIIDMKNVEDIETRISGGNIQWKYWKNKRWNNIEL